MIINNAATKQREEVELNPVRFEDTNNNDSFLGSIAVAIDDTLKGGYSGAIAKPSMLLGSAIVSASEFGDLLAGIDGESQQTQWLRNNLEATVRHTQTMNEDAQTHGMVNGLLFSAADVISSFVATGPSSLPRAALTAGITQGFGDYQKGIVVDELDKSTAAQRGAITGLSIGVGGYIPASMGFKLSAASKAVADAFGGIRGTAMRTGVVLNDIGFTTSANVATGAAHRGLTHDLLMENGYVQAAQQYKVIDEQALIADAVISLAFGGVGKYTEIRQQHLIDAAMSKSNELHQQTGISPGVPVDIPAMNKHNAAFNKAFSDMFNGRPVDVESILSDSNFAVKDLTEWYSQVTKSVTEFYPDLPLYYTQGDIPILGSTINDIRTRLQGDADLLMKVGDRKALENEIYDLEYRANRTELQRNDLANTEVKGSGQALSQARRNKIEQMRQLDNEMNKVREEVRIKRSLLTDHSKGGRYFEAKADMSRIEQGIIPDRFISEIIDSTGNQAMNAMGSENYYSLTRRSPELDVITPEDVNAVLREIESEGIIQEQGIDEIIQRSPEMTINVMDESGNETSIKASEAFDSVNKEVIQAQNDRQLYEAAAACMFRSA